MLRYTSAITWSFVTCGAPDYLCLNYSSILLLFARYPWAQMGTYSFCCTAVTQGQIVQILLLHGNKQGQI